MNDDISALLREADPLAHEPSPSEADFVATRRAILAAAGAPRVNAAWWPQPALIAATIVLTLAAGIELGRRFPEQTPYDATATVSGAPEVRQLQFATPGGTRIVWVFNQDFEP